jgi:transcriptional regulator with XRE-family HTH domain
MLQERDDVAKVLHQVSVTFDDEGFFRALDGHRRTLATTWRAIARDLDISPSTFSRLARGRRPDVDTFAKLVDWLGIPADRFIVGGSRAVGAGPIDPATLLRAALNDDPSLSDEDASALEDIFRVAYTRLRRPQR